MNILPAIDLYQGECVRLYQGKFEQLTSYSKNPLWQAQQFQQSGAKQLHIVDLAGAKQSSMQQLELILQLREQTNMTLQVGGGLASTEIIKTILDQQIDRAIIGSLAVKDPNQVKGLITQYGVARIVLALDISYMQKQPIVMIKAWQQSSKLTLWQLLQQYSNYSGLRILCTDISCDGALKGPNLALYKECIQRFPQFQFQASGGVQSLSDLTALTNTGVSDVVIGSALYTGKFTLNEALKEAETC